MPNNPNCKPGNRCGNCLKDQVASTKDKIRQAELRSRMTPDGLVICRDCKQSKPVEAFLRNDHGKPHQWPYCIDCYHQARKHEWQARDRFTHHRNIYENKRFKCIANCGALVSRSGRRCRPCYLLAKGTAGNKKVTVKKPSTVRPVVRTPKPAKTKAPAPVPKVIPKPKTMYVCIQGCGAMIETKDARCNYCRKLHQDMLASISTYKSNITNLRKSIAKGTAFGLLFIGDMDVWGLYHRCQKVVIDSETGVYRKCGRPILAGTTCYQCATGRPRTLTFLPRVEFAPQLDDLPAQEIAA